MPEGRASAVMQATHDKRTIKRHAPLLCRFFLGLLLMTAGMGVFPQSTRQSVRQNETASFNTIKAGLDERNIEYIERNLLAEYGVFGKSLFTGNAAPQENPFIFVFPVLDCRIELAFSLLDAAAGLMPDGAEHNEAAPNVAFLGDVWSASNASFNDLLESLDHPENAMLMYMSRTEDGSLAVTFFQGTVKNPFHLTGTFAQYLESWNVPFSFFEKTVLEKTANDETISGKTIVISPDVFRDTNSLTACLLDFAATNPRPEIDPDTHYIVADFRGRKIILSNLSILLIILAGSAGLLFVNLFFAVIFTKKRVFIIALALFFAFAAVLVLRNPLRSLNNPAYILAGIPGTTPPATQQDTSHPVTEPIVEAKETVFLDRITYTIKAEYPNEPYRITVFYDYDIGKDRLPGEVYETPFPYEVEEGRITFILGEYPPNPLEAEISFPRTGTLNIAAFFGPDDTIPSVWREGETKE
ncbi:MAG: hypothetical protein LBG27_05875 [Spirochaetaceae bacterium]|jgi:hypothetical protein|nr:hypothetical protein [Spirochaetaceae bacterium]